MRTVADLRGVLRRPGCSIFLSGVVVAGHTQPPPEEQATPVRVVSVCEEAIHLANGKFLPFGCCGAFEFDGSDDRFKVKIGPAVLQYEIVQGMT